MAEPLNLAAERNSLARSTKSTQQHVSKDIVPLLLVSIRFQVLFHSPPGVLFTFPSRYWFTIGCQLVFSLRRWASLIHTGSHVSRATWVHIYSCLFVFAYRAFTFCGRPFQAASTNKLTSAASSCRSSQCVPLPHVRNAGRL